MQIGDFRCDLWECGVELRLEGLGCLEWYCWGVEWGIGEGLNGCVENGYTVVGWSLRRFGVPGVEDWV